MTTRTYLLVNANTAAAAAFSPVYGSSAAASSALTARRGAARHTGSRQGSLAQSRPDGQAGAACETASPAATRAVSRLLVNPADLAATEPCWGTFRPVRIRCRQRSPQRAEMRRRRLSQSLMPPRRQQASQVDPGNQPELVPMPD